MGLQPGLYRGVLRIEISEVGYQVLHHRHVRQRIDTHLPAQILHGSGTGEAIDAVDVHGARAADALAAGAAEGERGVDHAFYLDERIEHHRAHALRIELEGIDARILAGVGIEAIDAKGADRAGTGRRRVRDAFDGARVGRQAEFGHPGTFQ